ncbi:MAG: 4Fe-4S binding protein [Syntrophomonas sp.]
MPYEKADKQILKRYRKLRLGILVAILLLVTGVGVAHQVMTSGALLGVDALCPFGAIEAAYTLAVTGVFIKKIALSSFILFAAVLIAALIFRRAFCGLICPLGTLQELVSDLGARIRKKRPNIPNSIDKPARYIKYILLLVIIIGSVTSEELVIRPYDPWAAYQHISSGSVLSELPIGFGLLVGTLLLSFLFSRVFCKYLCPMGALLGLIHRIGWFRIERNTETCINCKLCSKECPMGLPVAEVVTVDSAECINCGKCTTVCPVKDTLYAAGRKGKPVSSTAILGSVLAVFIVILGVTTATGDFQWTQKTLEQQVVKTGQFDPATITGKMTLDEVSRVSGIPKEAFKERFKLQDGDFTIPLKDLGPPKGFETSDVRTFVAEYLAKP